VPSITTLTITHDHKEEDRRQPGCLVGALADVPAGAFFHQVIGRQSARPPEIRQAGHDPADIGLQSGSCVEALRCAVVEEPASRPLSVRDAPSCFISASVAPSPIGPMSWLLVAGCAGVGGYCTLTATTRFASKSRPRRVEAGYANARQPWERSCGNVSDQGAPASDSRSAARVLLR
jgi:hypothetical protein